MAAKFHNKNSTKGKVNFKINLKIQVKKMNAEKMFPTASLTVVMSVTENGFYWLVTSKEMLKQLHHNSIYALRACLELKILLTMKFLSRQLQLLSPVGAAKNSSRVCVKLNAKILNVFVLKKVMKCNSKRHSSLPCYNKYLKFYFFMK